MLCRWDRQMFCIECEGTSTEITGWTITDNNGDRYIYRQREICADVEYVDVSTSNAISDSGIPRHGILPVFFHTMEHRLISAIKVM